MLAIGTSSAGSSARFTTATSTTTRPNITDHASRMPPTSSAPLAARAPSRLCFEKERVTAVDETRPPATAVIAVPRPWPSQRTAM